MSSQLRAVTVIVRGRVQGVGFRYTTRGMAQHHGLAGWVRNEPDGSVLVWAQGPAELVGQFTAGLRRGPRGAAVTSFEVEDVPPDPTLHRFEIRF